MEVSGHLLVSGLLALLCVAESTPAANAGGRKPKSDWDTYFGAGIAPAYPFSGTFQITRSKDYHFSYADADGDTTSFHCSSDQYSTDCADGSGIYTALIPVDAQPVNGQPISFSLLTQTDDPQAPLGWVVSGNPTLENFIEDAKAGRLVHFRWKDDPAGGSGKLVCIPIAGAELIPDGRARKDFAKQHRMESCYFANQDPNVETKNLSPAFLAILDKATAVKVSQAAVGSLSDGGDILSLQEQAEGIQKGEASKCSVVTTPAGAKILIDGDEAGISPMVFVLLRHGDTPRSIKITLNGYKIVEKRVVPDGKTIPISLKLEKN
jgi:hypothetical protein